MKKIFVLLCISILLVTGCVNNNDSDKTDSDKVITERTISSELYSYDIDYWQNNENEQDAIAKEIYDLWKQNDETFGINRIVDAGVTKEEINNYIQQYNPAEEEKIFTVACTVIDVKCDTYKIK